MEDSEMGELDPQPEQVSPTAVSIYGQGNGLDDFPVLKAFQQYVDAEQAKARKRLVTLCVFFGLLMIGVIGVFVLLLVNVSRQNQSLNDRMIDYVMRDRERERTSAPQPAPVVVQPSQDSAAILALTSKFDELQKKMTQDQAKAEALTKELAEKERQAAEKEKLAAVREAIAAERAAAEAAKPKGPSPAELEVIRLKALLEAEREKKSEREQRKIERERKHQADIEAYRRQHYPELYKDESPSMPKAKSRASVTAQKAALLTDDDAISYYDDEEDEEEEEEVVVRKPVKKPAPKKAPAVEKKTETDYMIPVEVRGTKSSWKIPD